MFSLRPTHRPVTAVAGLALALALSGCSSDTTDTTDTTDTNAAWCTGAATVESELTKMATLIDEGSPTDAVKAQWGAVQAAIEATTVPLTQLEDSTQQQISAAYDALSTSVEAIPSDAPTSETAPQYKAAIEEFTTEMQSIEDEVCS
jgi:hypothetical protein